MFSHRQVTITTALSNKTL